MKTADISATYVDHMGSDLSVVNAARVSFDKASDWIELNQEIDGVQHPILRVLRESDVKLINYLARNKHFSPFNHTFLCFRIKAPIFVARQLVKHKFMPWNEVSRRYVDSEPEFYIPEHWRTRADNVKQGSSTNSIDVVDADGWNWITPEEHTGQSLEFYKHLLKLGVCPEQARMVLPLNTHTEWIWSGTLGAFADMLRLRLDPHTQYESRLVAQLILAEVEKLFPVSIKALLNVSE